MKLKLSSSKLKLHLHWWNKYEKMGLKTFVQQWQFERASYHLHSLPKEQTCALFMKQSTYLLAIFTPNLFNQISIIQTFTKKPYVEPMLSKWTLTNIFICNEPSICTSFNNYFKLKNITYIWHYLFLIKSSAPYNK